jgi:hypothetical protein
MPPPKRPHSSNLVYWYVDEGRCRYGTGLFSKRDVILAAKRFGPYPALIKRGESIKWFKDQHVAPETPGLQREEGHRYLREDQRDSLWRVKPAERR